MLLLEPDIPNYIRSSQYLQSLLSEGSWPADGLEIPDGCAKSDLSVGTDADLLELLTTDRYWLVPEAAEESRDLPRYALLTSEKANNFGGIAKDFERDIPFVADLLAVRQAEDKTAQAAQQGNLIILIILCEEIGMVPTEAAGIAAAACGHLACLKWMNSHGLPFSRNLYRSACEHGQLACVKYLTECNSKWTLYAASFAVKSGDFECIVYAIGLRTSFNIPVDAPPLLHTLAENDKLHCIEQLLALPGWQNQNCIANAMRGAAIGGHIHILKYFMPQLTDLSRLNEFMYLTVPIDRMDCFSFLHQQGGEYCVRLTVSAAESGLLDVLQYLHEDGCPWDESVCNAAAGGGHIACLRYAHEHGCPWRIHNTPFDSFNGVELISAVAAGAPTVACLKYVVAHGAEINQQTCAVSSLSSRCVPILRFLHTRGVWWGREHMSRLAEIGWLPGLAFLHRMGCRWCSMTTQAAAYRKHIYVLQYALQHGCPYDDDLLVTVKRFGPAAEECVRIIEQRDAGTHVVPELS